MIHYDAIDYLGALFFGAMAVIFTLGWWISSRWPRSFKNRRRALRAPLYDERDSIRKFHRRMKP